MTLSIRHVVSPVLPIHLGGVAAVALVLSVFSIVIVRPRTRAADDVARLGWEISEAERKIEAQRATGERAIAELAKLRTQLEAEPAVLGPVSKLNARLAEVSKRAESMGIRVVELVPGTEQKGSAAVKVPIRLRGEGTYAAITGLLARTHADFPDLAVAKLSIKGEPNNPESPASISIDFEWYAERAEGAGAGGTKN